MIEIPIVATCSVVCMVGYMLLSKVKLTGKHRCNCRNKIMRIKKNQKRFNDSIK